MSQEKPKMPVSRQIRYLRGSRDNWKQNLAKKQQKIPLTTMNLTPDVIKKALETIRVIDLSQWVNNVYGINHRL